MIGKNILKAQMCLEKGHIIAIPTETVYGLAGNAYDASVVAKIFKIKNRPLTSPLTLQTSSIDRIGSFVKHIPHKARQLAEAFWPGPLTLLLDKQLHVPKLVTAGLPTVGVRIPDHPLTLALLKKLSFPLAVPSANLSGYISPTTAQHVYEQLGTKVPYILDGGKATLGIESTIIGFRDSIPMLYRLGYITQTAIEKVVGPVQQANVEKVDSLITPYTRGTATHYTLRTPLIIGHLPTLLKEHGYKQVAILCFDKPIQGIDPTYQVVLSTKRDLREAAQRLFGALQYLDNLGVSLILASRLPEQGLGRVINDRLQKASK